MVLSDNPAYVERMRAYRNLCFQRDRRFYHTELGSNLRLTNLQAALGAAQVERMEELVARKQRMGHRYSEALKHLSGLQLPVEEAWARHVYWVYGIVVHERTGFDAVTFAGRLRELGVETRPFFLGMHERIARQGLYVPSGMALSEAQIDEVCEAVRTALERGRVA